VLKLGGLVNISDQLHNIFKKCPLLEVLEANNLERLSDNFLDHLKNYPGQKTIHLNFTPNITDDKLKDLAENCKNLKIIRTITKMTDPADDGLRMPIPPASLKIKKPKKKKK
jgi:F-box/leucine-rich repeat protein 2/20